MAAQESAAITVVAPGCHRAAPGWGETPSRARRKSFSALFIAASTLVA